MKKEEDRIESLKHQSQEKLRIGRAGSGKIMDKNYTRFSSKPSMEDFQTLEAYQL
jgi:hypothetical protein